MVSTSYADSIRPAYLEIMETSPGLVDITWKVPTVPGLPADLQPELPPSFRSSTPVQRIEAPDSVTFTWSMIGEGLTGGTITIRGLDAYTMDALLRIVLHDGTKHRTVLRPTTAAFTIPAAGQKGRSFTTALWLYPALFAAACLLMLTPAARRRGAAYCSLALVAGSLSGNAIGHALPKQKTGLSEDEARRALQGLMLNTYRAFIMDTDEEVYDILARSVRGDALSEIYLANRDRLRFDDPESAASLVDRLDVKSIGSIRKHKDGSYTILADWDVYGSVFHWEHVHFRCNAFKARVTIFPEDGYWKISQLEVLDEERVI